MSSRIWRINVETCVPQYYLEFLEDLRDELAEHWAIESDGGTWPILALQSNSTEWINIRLETNHNSITLRVSRANLYVKGFQTSDGRVFELAEKREQQVPDGPTPLGFGGSHRELLGAAGKSSQGTITDLLAGSVHLGLNRLRDAVNSLAKNPQDKRVAGQTLLDMVWMISEAARFPKMAEAAATRSEVPVTRAMAQLVMLWGDISRRVLQAFAHPLLHSFMIPDDILKDLGISTAAAVLRHTGILLFSLPNYVIEKSSGGHKPEAPPSSGATPEREAALFYYTVGATLAEVFYVTIDDIDGESPGDLYGKITVTDSYGSQSLFNRDRDDFQSIYPGSNALLTGPAKAISANDAFTIDLKLKDKDSDPSPDDEVVNAQICWNPYDGGNAWNQSIKKVVSGQYGKATVCYGVFENAVVASVEVKVLNVEDPAVANADKASTANHVKKDASTAKVYGWVKAAKSLDEIELFRKKKDERVKVARGDLISLSRSTLVVPMNGALKISADLHDYVDQSHDDNFADGSAMFTPKTLGSEKHNIDGRHSKVEVKVTWSMF